MINELEKIVSFIAVNFFISNQCINMKMFFVATSFMRSICNQKMLTQKRLTCLKKSAGKLVDLGENADCKTVK